MTDEFILAMIGYALGLLVGFVNGWIWRGVKK